MPSSYADMSIQQLRLCSREGDTEAQYLLGVRLLSMRGGAMEGADHLKEAARKRHLQACERLGSVYLYGEGGIPQDKKQAVVYYEQALALGSLTARTRLIDLYLEDESKAMRGLQLLTEVAELGDQKAAARAARLYLSGEVVGVDIEKAARYAALSDDGAVLYEAAEKLDLLDTDEELRDELYHKLLMQDREDAHLGIPALVTLGRMYMQGKGTPPNGPAAERVLQRAAQLEERQRVRGGQAQLLLAQLYETGAPGLPADHDAALRLLKALYKEGNEVAHLRYVKLCTADGRHLDAYRAYAEARRYAEATEYVAVHWESIPDKRAFVRRALLFAGTGQRDHPDLRALRNELYRRASSAGQPADETLRCALEMGDISGALEWFEGLEEREKREVYRNRELCASLPAERENGSPELIRLRALLREIPKDVMAWEPVPVQAAKTDAARVEAMTHLVCCLRAVSADRVRAQALHDRREALRSDPLKQLRFDLQTLLDLQPRQRSEGVAVNRLRADLWMQVRGSWSSFAEYFGRMRPDEPKDVRKARFFAREYLQMAAALYEHVPCAEYDEVCAAVERILEPPEARAVTKQGEPIPPVKEKQQQKQAAEPKGEWQRRLQAFNELNEESKKREFANGPLGRLPEKQPGEDAALSILRSLLTPYQAGNELRSSQSVLVQKESLVMEPPRRKKSGAWKVLLSVLLVLCIGAGAFLVWNYLSERDDTPAETAFPSQTQSIVPDEPEADAVSLTELQPIEAPGCYYVDRWDNNVYRGDLTVLDGEVKRVVSGIGWYVPSSSIGSKQEGAQGQVSAKYSLGERYSSLTFTASADQEWTDGDQAGTFQLTILCDGKLAYDSGWCDSQTSLQNVVVELSGCEELTLVLSERRGVKGTLNVVMGDIWLS